ncbi:MAG TPA: PfkB family carbohydrate kinase [Bryobacteraceae bacterium]|nr:PfkB family carbohydrate kinase [Bryobacteraceae bacterium]
MDAARILAGFAKLRALVIGDVCLDRWCRYDPAQRDPSRETGIPRVAVIEAEVSPGAAGTVASNLAALRVGQVAVLGVVGDDGHGHELARALRQRSISSDHLIASPRVATFTYTKLINSVTGVEDLPRVDYINEHSLPDVLESEVLKEIWKISNDFDVVLVSDQAETASGGVVTPRIRDTLCGLRHDVVWVDSRARAEHFRNVILKPNRQECDAASVRAFGRVDDRAFREHTNAKLLVITHGPGGALVVDGADETWVRTKAVENPVDICGAGDSFSAGAAMALAVTGSAVEAARFGNLVASITIMKKGTGTASPEEVLAIA